MKRYDNLDLSRHPLLMLSKLALRHDIKGFKLRTYRVSDNGPYGITFRDVGSHLVPASHLIGDAVSIMEEAAKKNLDVAIDSEVETAGGYRHLGLIDFSVDASVVPGPSFRDALRDSGARFTEVTTCYPTKEYLDLYSTGRSYHGYVLDQLFTEDQWRRFTTSLLLLAPGTISGTPVDTRWVGHRLLQGSGCLRLSCTDEHYLQMPEKIKEAPSIVKRMIPSDWGDDMPLGINNGTLLWDD